MNCNIYDFNSLKKGITLINNKEKSQFHSLYSCYDFVEICVFNKHSPGSPSLFYVIYWIKCNKKKKGIDVRCTVCQRSDAACTGSSSLLSFLYIRVCVWWYLRRFGGINYVSVTDKIQNLVVMIKLSPLELEIPLPFFFLAYQWIYWVLGGKEIY